MNVSTLQTLSFTLLLIICTSLGESHPDPVLDWAGNPVEARVPYELWIVGHHMGPIGTGSFTDQSLGRQYVIDKQWDCNRTFYGTPVIIYPASSTTLNTVVPVATYSALKFVNDKWINIPNDGSIFQNFLITTNTTLPPAIGFQFIQVNGTTYNPYLYKLIATRKGIPMDVISITNPAGEKSLYLNQGNSIPDTWGTRISFVKSRQSQKFTRHQTEAEVEQVDLSRLSTMVY